MTITNYLVIFTEEHIYIYFITGNMIYIIPW
jgi:hypothetical protein